MANTKSAQKAARQTIRRTAVNKSRRTEMRTYIRKVEEAIAAKDPKGAAEALGEAEPRLARAAQKGIVHRNTATGSASTRRARSMTRRRWRAALACVFAASSGATSRNIVSANSGFGPPQARRSIAEVSRS
jgi:small subunit ribosomal protein S20